MLTKLKTCVYMSNGLVFAAGGLLLRLAVYVRPADRPPSTDIGSGERDTTAMCERSVTVNISLAVSCPPSQHLRLTEAQTLAARRVSGQKCSFHEENYTSLQP